MLILHGIPNCDIIKKARDWLDARGEPFVFHDYRKAGVDAGWLRARVAEHGWETVLNRAGTTFRALPDADRAVLNAERALALMLAQPAMIKRPILMLEDGSGLIGFKPDVWADRLG